MTARSTESKVKEAKDLHNTISAEKMPAVKELQKTHKSISNTGSVGGKTPNNKQQAQVSYRQADQQGDEMQDPGANAVLPPINKSVPLVLEGQFAPKNAKIHKNSGKPAATLQHTQ